MRLPVPITLLFAMKILSVLSQVKFQQDSDISESKLPSLDVPPEAKCTCIPFYDCYDEESSSVINNVVNDRTDRTVITVSQSEPGECLDILDICCYNLGPSSATTESTKHPPQPESPSIIEVSTQDITTSPPVQPQAPISAFSLIKTETTVLQGDRTGVAGQDIESIRSCGVRNIDGFNFTIAGFKDGQAQYGEFPWMVAVLTSGEGLGAANLFVGGGSLIDPSVVLTAAHKIIDVSGTLTARIGEWNFAGTSEPIQTQDIPVSEIIYYNKKYNKGTKTYNYALLVLERPAVLGETVGTICLPSKPELRFDNQQCIVSGWGKNIFGEEGRYQRILKSVSVNMVEHSQCQSAFQTTELGSSFNLHLSFVCAGDQGQDACTGDGGSPLVCSDPDNPRQYVQAGISAWGLGCGQKGIPGVYSSVAIATPWINEQLDGIRAQPLKIEVNDKTVIGHTQRCSTHHGFRYVDDCKKCNECPKCHNFNHKTCRCHRRFRCRN